MPQRYSRCRGQMDLQSTRPPAGCDPLRARRRIARRPDPESAMTTTSRPVPGIRPRYPVHAPSAPSERATSPRSSPRRRPRGACRGLAHPSRRCYVPPGFSRPCVWIFYLKPWIRSDAAHGPLPCLDGPGDGPTGSCRRHNQVPNNPREHIGHAEGRACIGRRGSSE
jgi:hypothetical protein